MTRACPSQNESLFLGEIWNNGTASNSYRDAGRCQGPHRDTPWTDKVTKVQGRW